MNAASEKRERFERRYREWRERVEAGETALSSADGPYVDNPEFRAIVAMGWDAVPYLIEKLRSDENAHFLIHALAAITGERPSVGTGGREAGGRPTAEGNQAVAEAWVAWWEARQAPDDRSSHSDESGT